MSWNYRVMEVDRDKETRPNMRPISVPGQLDEDVFIATEVYYDDKGKPDAYAEASAPAGETKEEAHVDAKAQIRAFFEPAVKQSDFHKEKS